MKNQELIEHLNHCAAVCGYCADACLNEDNIKMLVECIRLDRDCASICAVTADLWARDSDYASELVKVCERICGDCAEECEKHADMHDHCRECAEACRECQDACRSYANA